LDHALREELERIAESMEEASKQAQDMASQPDATTGKTAEQLGEMKQKLAGERQDYQEGVTTPLEKLSRIYPLLEDQARFAELYERQRDLAERLSSLKGQDPPDDPRTKARMRDLEQEQRKTREDLNQLLGDIENHVAQLPDDVPDIEQLAQSARDFVQNVRESQADAEMSNAEQGLAEFSGTQGHSQATQAADTLEQFLSRCQGMGVQAGQACKGLKFAPGEGSLGETLDQLLQDAGLGMKDGQKPGQMGTGSGGGYSARRQSMQNMGLYGHLPVTRNPNQSGRGNRQQRVGVIGSYGTTGDRDRGSQLDPHGMLRASGAGESAIPARYRGRIQQYFQRIAEETGGVR
jgi:uncharacterized protein YoxC